MPIASRQLNAMLVQCRVTACAPDFRNIAPMDPITDPISTRTMDEIGVDEIGVVTFLHQSFFTTPAQHRDARHYNRQS